MQLIINEYSWRIPVRYLFMNSVMFNSLFLKKLKEKSLTKLSIDVCVPKLRMFSV